MRDQNNPQESQFSEQIALGMRNAILNREIDPNSELPSLREMSTETGHSVNTVKAAYEILRQEGLISKPGGLTSRYRVTSSPWLHSRIYSIKDDVENFFALMKTKGYSRLEVLSVINKDIK